MAWRIEGADARGIAMLQGIGLRLQQLQTTLQLVLLLRIEYRSQLQIDRAHLWQQLVVQSLASSCQL